MAAALAGSVGASVPAAAAQDGPNERWRLEIDGEADGGPTVIDGEVLVTIDDAGQSLYSFDGDTGEENWDVSGVGSPDLYHDPHVVDGTLYAASSDGMAKAFDLETRELEWTFEPEGDYFAEPPTVADDAVYVVGSETEAPPTLFAVDAEDGEELWSHEGDGGNEDPPIVVGETVYYSTGQMVFAVDATDGEERWSRELGEGTPRSITVTGDVLYTVYTERSDGGSTQATILALDAETGEDVWSVDTDESRSTTPTVYDGKVLGYAGDNLVALDVEDGEELWRYSVDRPDSNTPPTVAGGVVYVGSYGLDPWEGFIHAVDVDSGDGLWTEEIGDFRVQNPPIVSDGTLYAWVERDPDGAGVRSDLVALDVGDDASSEDSRALQAAYNHHDGWTGDASADFGADGTDDDGLPGFGLVSAAAAVGGVGYLLKRRGGDGQHSTE